MPNPTGSKRPLIDAAGLENRRPGTVNARVDRT
jgi:hypothetical protein